MKSKKREWEEKEKELNELLIKAREIIAYLKGLSDASKIIIKSMEE